MTGWATKVDIRSEKSSEQRSELDLLLEEIEPVIVVSVCTEKEIILKTPIRDSRIAMRKIFIIGYGSHLCSHEALYFRVIAVDHLFDIQQAPKGRLLNVLTVNISKAVKRSRESAKNYSVLLNSYVRMRTWLVYLVSDATQTIGKPEYQGGIRPRIACRDVRGRITSATTDRQENKFYYTRKVQRKDGGTMRGKLQPPGRTPAHHLLAGRCRTPALELEFVLATSSCNTSREEAEVETVAALVTTQDNTSQKVNVKGKGLTKHRIFSLPLRLRYRLRSNASIIFVLKEPGNNVGSHA
ncbi:uncharacterized protein EV420DRAFT_1482661 [Desarmillaria tabescens]|uniref:Uncharacterized protein n=1 Tax=Armillaria tabescens TaxID=1929756 RepID=A0AA39MXP2_ARMTA|nr:uncharacterized protein EV420DRAFT_1482661 [Desarmillaria tabescens]KAK0450452.1 hypothetical protein EV420DRAFT_1482661 [Desarmillaria tabescens]